MESPTFRSLLKLALPMVISRSTQTLVSFADLLMVAPLGTQAIAATATGATNSYALLIFPLGTCFLVQSFSAQYFGKGDITSARRFGWYGLAIALLTQLLCLAAWPFVQSAVNLSPAEPTVQNLMGDYIRLRLLSGGCAIGIEALGAYFSGLSRTTPAMGVNILAMALNVLLNWMLIFGHWGFQPMGVAGAALASSISTAVAFGVFLTIFVREGRISEVLALRFREWLRLIRFGAPSGLNWLFEFLAFLFFINAVVTRLGTDTLAAMNSVLQVNQVSFMPAFGLASAGAVLVGQSLGAKSIEAAKKSVRLTLVVSTLWMGLVGAVCLVFAVPIVSLFQPDNASEAKALTALATTMLRISVAWQLFDAVSMTLSEALRAAGDTLFPLMGRLVIAWLVFVPGAYLTVQWWHGTEVSATLWLVIYLVLLSLVLGWRYRSGVWQQMALVEQPPPTL
jgi:multidrug resistance protein, MATE family